jgi:hypothetical protein
MSLRWAVEVGGSGSTVGLGGSCAEAGVCVDRGSVGRPDTLRAETHEERVNVPGVGESEGAKATVVFDVET